MYKKISAFLIFLFALNVFLEDARIYRSPVLAQSVSEEKPADEEMSKEEAKSTLKKIFGMVILPFTYALQWAMMKIMGPAKISVTYSIYIDKFRKPSSSRPIFYIDDPQKKVKKAKIILPILLFHEKTKVITATHFQNHIQEELAHLAEYMKETPMASYKRASSKLKKIKASDVKTKYGDMIHISYFGVTDPAFKFDITGSKRKIKQILPYDLSKEYSLVYEKKLKDRKDYGGKGYYGNAQKIATYLYVEWEGKGQLRMDFHIGMGARFGWAGRTGMSYLFCPEQPDKTVKYRKYRSGNYLEQELIFKKPGWHKVCMVKDEGISAL